MLPLPSEGEGWGEGDLQVKCSFQVHCFGLLICIVYSRTTLIVCLPELHTLIVDTLFLPPCFDS